MARAHIQLELAVQGEAGDTVGAASSGTPGTVELAEKTAPSFLGAAVPAAFCSSDSRVLMPCALHRHRNVTGDGGIAGLISPCFWVKCSRRP